MSASMERRDLLGLLGMAVLGRGQATPDSARAKFAGIYRLVAYAPYGSDPAGRIYYDRAGGMGAMLFPPGRRPLPQNPTIEDYRAVQRGVIAYYATYDVDESTKRVIHHVVAASNPVWVGSDFIRWYELSGDRLTLRTSPTSNSPLVWERLPAS